ncbi:hypothetical protein HKX48_008308 [Thoreauomyces humboldtii]|nr:hypothetical protein HKX48_008308 [Thoreauomyces humboldtii]
MEKCVRFSVQTQVEDSSTIVASKEGEAVNMAASVLYRLDPGSASDLYKSVGKGYREVLIRPQLRSALHETASGQDGQDLRDSSTRSDMMRRVEQMLRASLTERGILVEEVRLRDLLPGSGGRGDGRDAGFSMTVRA